MQILIKATSSILLFLTACTTSSVGSRGPSLDKTNLIRTGENTYVLSMKNPATNSLFKAKATNLIQRSSSALTSQPLVLDQARGTKTFEKTMSPKVKEAEMERLNNLGPPPPSSSQQVAKNKSVPTAPNKPESVNVDGSELAGIISISGHPKSEIKPIGLLSYYACCAFLLIMGYVFYKNYKGLKALKVTTNPFEEKKPKHLGEGI